MSICLAMIVRDEETVLARCLESTLSHVDEMVIVDTGSTDSTPLVARQMGATVRYAEWRDFGTTRTDMLNIARGYGHDYLLLLDADDELLWMTDEPLSEASYNATVIDGGPEYTQPRLVSTRIDWRYQGATHEYLTSDEVPIPGDAVSAMTIRHHCDGSRRPRKFTEDESLLRAELARTPDDPRTVFYLANTLRDLGRIEEAIPLYWQRARMGGWQAEAEAAAVQVVRLQAGDLSPIGVPSVVAA